MIKLLSKYSAREQALVICAVLILIGLGVHAVVIEPFLIRQASVEDELAQRKADLEWMQTAVLELPLKSSNAVKTMPAGSLANVIDKEVNRQKLKPFLSQMTPVGDDEIRIRYTGIHFDRLMRFIATINNFGLDVKDLRIDAGEKPSLVDCSIVFIKGS